MVNLKQPNFPVFLGTNCGYPPDSVRKDGLGGGAQEMALKAALDVAKTHRLMGLLCYVKPMVSFISSRYLCNYSIQFY
jgi:hypothetical protein